MDYSWGNELIKFGVGLLILCFYYGYKFKTRRKRSRSKSKTKIYNKNDSIYTDSLNIDTCINYIATRINKFEKYEIPDYILNHADVNFFNNKPLIYKLFEDMLYHVDLSDANVKLYLESYQPTIKGTYSNFDNDCITVYLDNQQDIYYIAAILAHEISHYYLEQEHITIAGYENELITDITTAFLGFGRYVFKAYFRTENMSLGYISENDYQHVLDRISYLRCHKNF